MDEDLNGALDLANGYYTVINGGNGDLDSAQKVGREILKLLKF